MDAEFVLAVGLFCVLQSVVLGTEVNAHAKAFGLNVLLLAFQINSAKSAIHLHLNVVPPHSPKLLHNEFSRLLDFETSVGKNLHRTAACKHIYTLGSLNFLYIYMFLLLLVVVELI